jgi:integrase/recombinase XerC/integrase/recombinase XerD
MNKIYKTWQDELFEELKIEFGKEKAFRYDKVLPIILTKKECLKLIDVYQTGKKAFRNRLIIRILYATGMRISEIENIKVCDINLGRRVLFIRNAKGNKDRNVIIDKESAKLINEFILENSLQFNDDLIDIKKRQLQYVVEKAGELIGLDKKYKMIDRRFSAHSLRHAFATHSFENGMDIFTLRKLLGHEYLETTQIYVHTSIKFEKSRYDKTNPFV